MVKIRFLVDPIGNTFSMWYQDPKKEDVCEQNEAGDILSLDKDGVVIGFEKINFLPREFIDQLDRLSKVEYEGHLLNVSKNL